MVTQEFLVSIGFQRDLTCPAHVNRWEKTVKNGALRDYYVSITLSEDGTHTLYGILNFYSENRNTNSRFLQERLSEHRKFKGVLYQSDYCKFVDRNVKFNQHLKDNQQYMTSIKSSSSDSSLTDFERAVKNLCWGVRMGKVVIRDSQVKPYARKLLDLARIELSKSEQ